MRRIFPIMAIALCLLIACHNSDEDQSRQPDIDTTKNLNPLTDTVVLHDSIKLDIAEGATTIQSHIKPKQHLIYAFENGDYTKGQITVTPKEKKGNIRIAQLIYPDQHADGPWGNSLSIQLSQKGLYRIVLGQNTMAGDPWEGDFELEIELSK